jgi:hypothetical protein
MRTHSLISLLASVALVACGPPQPTQDGGTGGGIFGFGGGLGGGGGAGGGAGGGGGGTGGGGCARQCTGKVCGNDGCGGTCGSCGDGQSCDASGQCVAVTLSWQAKAVGAYSQVGSTCAASSGGSKLTGYGMFLCPGGKIRAAGYVGSATNLQCGDYTAAAPVYPNCTDRYGCFPKVTATVKDTLILGGQSNVQDGFVTWMYLIGRSDGQYLYKDTECNDGSDADILLKRIAVDVADNYCNSDACPQPGGSSGGSGTCGTDCDCGHCWYCDTSGSSHTCRYGGEGPYGCYRGCGG